MTESIYLDHNATTPIDPSVVDAMRCCFVEASANPGSQHAGGRKARRWLEDAREQIAEILGAEDFGRSHQLVFTSGGTEANNLALLGSVGDTPGRLIISSIEHPSVLAAARVLQRRGWHVDWILVDAAGQIKLDHLAELLRRDETPRLVSVMLANNETGVLQPVEEVVRQCRPLGVPVHTDAAQVVGKMPVRFSELGVDAMTFAAHKFHGPCGVGGLLHRQLDLHPIMFGGAQQLGMRPGTEPVALAVGMQTALQRWHDSANERAQRMMLARDRLEQRLRDGDPTVVVNGDEPRIPNTVNLAFPGVDRQALLMALDLAGVACSTGSACASGSSEPSHVLQAMGFERARVESSLRFSFGSSASLMEADLAADRILSTVKRLRQADSPPNSLRTARGRSPKSL